jgi:hypothetical protein
MFKFIHERKHIEFNWELITKAAIDISYGMECMHGSVSVSEFCES